MSEERQAGTPSLQTEPGDPAKLAETILSLYNDPNKREAMGQQGREQAVTSYSREAVVSQYNDLLYKVVNRRKSPLASA